MTSAPLWVSNFATMSHCWTFVFAALCVKLLNARWCMPPLSHCIFPPKRISPAHALRGNNRCITAEEKGHHHVHVVTSSPLKALFLRMVFMTLRRNDVPLSFSMACPKGKSKEAVKLHQVFSGTVKSSLTILHQVSPCSGSQCLVPFIRLSPQSPKDMATPGRIHMNDSRSLASQVNDWSLKLSDQHQPGTPNY